MALLAVLWGYSWVVAKIGLAYSGPFDFAALRVLIATIVMGLYLALTGKSLRPEHFKFAVAIGLIQTAAFLLLNTWALSEAGPGKISILVFTMPFWVLLFAWRTLGERVDGFQWIAVALALVGLLLVLEPWRLHASLFAKSIAVLAGVCWALSVVMAKQFQKRATLDLLNFTFWQMLIGFVPMGLVAWFAPERAIDWSWQLCSALLFSGIVATALGWLMWVYVLQHLPAGTASVSSLAIPVIATASSAIQLGERLQPLELTGMAAIVIALGIMSWDTVRRHQPNEPLAAAE